METNINGTRNRKVAKATRCKIGAGAMGFLMQQANNAMDAGVWDQIDRDANMNDWRDQNRVLSWQQEEMARNNQQRNKDLWDYTNYENQVKHLEAAGLNTALMYGKGGGGGATAAGGTGAAPSGGGGTAAKGTGSAMGMIGAQSKLIDAQTDNVKMDTAKKEVEKDKLAGVDTEKVSTEIKSLTQGIENQKAVEALTKADERLRKIQGFNEESMSEDRINEVMWNAQKAWAETSMALNDQWVSTSTMNEKREIIAQAAIEAVLKNELTEAQISAVRQTIKNSIADIHLKAGAQDIEWWKAQVNKNLTEAGLNIAQQKVVLDALNAVAKGGR